MKKIVDVTCFRFNYNYFKQYVNAFRSAHQDYIYIYIYIYLTINDIDEQKIERQQFPTLVKQMQMVGHQDNQ